MSIYYVPGSVLRALFGICILILPATLWWRNHYQPLLQKIKMRLKEVKKNSLDPK